MADTYPGGCRKVYEEHVVKRARTRQKKVYPYPGLHQYSHRSHQVPLFLSQVPRRHAVLPWMDPRVSSPEKNLQQSSVLPTISRFARRHSLLRPKDQRWWTTPGYHPQRTDYSLPFVSSNLCHMPLFLPDQIRGHCQSPYAGADRVRWPLRRAPVCRGEQLYIHWLW